MPIQRDCPICHGREHHALKIGGESRLPLRPVVCRQCGLVFINPMYREAEKLSGTLGARAVHRPVRLHATLADAQRRQQPGARRVMEMLVDRVRPGQRVLDIGCGDGALLCELQQMGAEPMGCDLDPQAADYLQATRGIPVVTASFEEAQLESGAFDFIVATHVIEHFFDPIEALQKMRGLLKPNGTLVLETPNLLRPKVGPRRLFSVPHNYYFTPRTLCLALARAGFRAASIREFHRDSFLVASSPHDDDAGEHLPGDPWQEVVHAIEAHAQRYHATLQFLWRKIPRVNASLMYRVHRDIAGEPLKNWLRKAS